jgi:hypothetical protein
MLQLKVWFQNYLKQSKECVHPSYGRISHSKDTSECALKSKNNVTFL